MQINAREGAADPVTATEEATSVDQQTPVVGTSQDVPQFETSSLSPSQPEQYLLVLSGLIGSGKSTFAKAVVNHYPNWTRCNQDELGSREAVEVSARKALLAGKNVIIDRTNIDAKQRRTWLELAASTSGVPIITVSLTITIPTHLAEERLRCRTDHETIRNPQQAQQVLVHFLRAYQKAIPQEGFNYTISIPATAIALDPSKEDIQRLFFDRIASSEKGDGKLPDRPPTRSFRGSNRGGYRGALRGNTNGRGRSALFARHHRVSPSNVPQEEQGQQLQHSEIQTNLLSRRRNGTDQQAQAPVKAAWSRPQPYPPSQQQKQHLAESQSGPTEDVTLYRTAQAESRFPPLKAAPEARSTQADQVVRPSV